MPPRKRTRADGGSRAAAGDTVAADTTAADLNSVKRLLMAMAKAQVAALDDTPPHGSDVVALAEQLEGLAQTLVNKRKLQDEAELLNEQEGAGEDEDEEGGEDEDGGDGSSDVRRGIEARMVAHEFIGAPILYNRSTCGVCPALRECGEDSPPGCGKYACWTCQVHICSWHCLDAHNLQGKGKPAIAWIYKCQTNEDGTVMKDEKGRPMKLDEVPPNWQEAD
jgi:hypothetical protein